MYFKILNLIFSIHYIYLNLSRDQGLRPGSGIKHD